MGGLSMDKNKIIELTSCPLMSQIVINTKTISWENYHLLMQLLKGRRSMKYLAMNGFDWENSPQGDSYWNTFDDGHIPHLRHWN